MSIKNIFFSDARSFCLEQRADLVSMSSAAIIRNVGNRLSRLRPLGWWIGLTGRDYPSMYYWTDASPVNYIGWGGYFGYGMLYFLTERIFLLIVLIFINFVLLQSS